jgi:predicted NAD-dependent protein-ADP-ribosyltransferase YbiA (DUF1768 family)
MWVLEVVSPFLIPVIQWLTRLVLWFGDRVGAKENVAPKPTEFPVMISEVAKFTETDWEAARKRVFAKDLRKKLGSPYTGRRTDEGEE